MIMRWSYGTPSRSRGNPVWSAPRSRGRCGDHPPACRDGPDFDCPAPGATHLNSARPPAERKYVSVRGLFPLLLFAALGASLVGCSGKVKHPTSTGTPAPPRSYRMGFSAIPPRADFALLLASLELWTRRADAAILHVSPPWAALLDGAAADSAVRLQHLGLVDYYRSKGLDLVVMLDVTDGLNRAAEAPELIAAGRSITEPEVQQLYRAYAVAMDTLLRPRYLGLAAETNLIRAASSPALYAALVQMVNAGAADVRAHDASVKLYVSVQVETAWGRLAGPGPYVGIAADLADFPFLQAIGLSSYPYLGGFTEPEQRSEEH